MRVVRFGLAVVVGVVVALSLATPVLATSSFPDVPEDHVYHAAIVGMADRGIIGGYTNGNFGPDDLVTRQQFAKMIVKTMDLTVTGSEVCPFTDVADQMGTDPFYPSKYVAVCAANGITTGKTATTFDPTGNITRQQVMTMIVRAADNLAPGSLVEPPDQVALSLYYGDPTHGANVKKFDYNHLTYYLGLPSSSTAASWQAENATRGDVAVMLWNLLGAITYGSPVTNVPEILSPADGTVISTLPRTTTVTWAPFANATGYSVWIFRWDESTGTYIGGRSAEVSDTSYTFTLDGPGKAMVRVCALTPIGPTELARSSWIVIEYTQ